MRWIFLFNLNNDAANKIYVIAYILLLMQYDNDNKKKRYNFLGNK